MDSTNAIEGKGKRKTNHEQKQTQGKSLSIKCFGAGDKWQELWFIESKDQNAVLLCSECGGRAQEFKNKNNTFLMWKSP
jgi:hypothetical protein